LLYEGQGHRKKNRIYELIKCTRWAKKSAPIELSINRVKICDVATFSLKLNVEQAAEVNANKHLLVLNILWIKSSVYDVKCDVS